MSGNESAYILSIRPEIELMTTTAPAKNRDIYTISRLNQEVAQMLSGNFPVIWLEGEISNLAMPRSGHWYLSLKDIDAQLRAAMFRNRNTLVEFKPEDGMQVLVRGRVALYEPRGDFQFIIEHMEAAGDGLLRRAFEQLKNKLHAEGLFDEARKKPLPPQPQCIGVVTSATGAAIRDVLSVLRRRYPIANILIYPSLVQGANAAQDISNTLLLANQRQDCDVLLLVRGGGSLEDLHAFNDEHLARTIAASDIPIISGIGHEIDFTIADFVADLRAATPSAAAELASPDIEELRLQANMLHERLYAAMEQTLETRSESLAILQRRLSLLHPQRRLEQQNQRLDELEKRLKQLWQLQLQQRQAQLGTLHSKLFSYSPINQVKAKSILCSQWQQRLQSATINIFKQKEMQLKQLSRGLSAVSPLATLERGYAIVTNDSGNIIRDAQSVNQGDTLAVQLAKGQLTLTVK